MDQRTREQTLRQARERAERARKAARERSNRMYGGSDATGTDHESMARENAIREAVARAQTANRTQHGQTGQRAMDSARRAAEEIQRRHMYGGYDGQHDEEAVRRAVQDASRRAAQKRQNGQRANQYYEDDEDDQDGGWGKGSSKTVKLVKRLENNKAKGKEVTGSVNSHRSFKAFVNGKELTGNGTKGVGTTKRYFHGTPSAAARKVVAILHKGVEKSGINAVNVTGVGKAVDIRLEEVTKGVRKADGGRFTHEYFGWREDTPAKTVTKNGPNGPIQVTFSGRNRVVPKRKFNSAQEAMNASEKIGQNIKSKKGL